MADEAHSGLRIVLLVVPDFNLAATMGVIDPFRAANYLNGASLCRWVLVSEPGGLCRASNGALVETRPLAGIAPARDDIVLVSSSWAPERHATPGLARALRLWARIGARLGALDTGAFILAELGLLDGRRATVHYEHIDALQEMYPAIEVVENLYVIDGPRMSCCGGLASVDLGLTLLDRLHGPALANSAARYIFHDRLRRAGALQLPEEGEPLGRRVPERLRRAIRAMEAHLEDPLPIPEVSRRAGISHRQLDRLFAAHIGKTPAVYYRDIRLDRARGLVTQTELPIGEVALAAGFASPVHFARAYGARFGLPPGRDRIEGRVPFEFRAWPMHRRPRGR